MDAIEPSFVEEDLAQLGEVLLARSEPALRRARGVYATPRPLVLYLARSVHALLKSRFARATGLADLDVRLLDPCAGPMNFVLEAWHEALAEGSRQGVTPAVLLRQHLLPHSRGVELLPIPYRLGQLAVRQFLDRHGYRLAKGERLPLELADALAGPQSSSGVPAVPGSRPTIPVLLGNPPYAGKSANRGRWISELLHGYPLPEGGRDEGFYRVEGRALGERNAKWLQDDAVKFLRFAQWTVDQAGQGIVAFVLNHNCLEALTFRGLRASLLRTFEEVYALDLHGNRRKRETAQDGGPDGNVFRGVAQGIGILVLVKRPGLARRALRADLHGERDAKLRELLRSTVETTLWTELHPRPPSYRFVSGDARLEREYRRGVSLTAIFAVGTTGVITGRDALLTDLDRRAFEARLVELRGDPRIAPEPGTVPGFSAACRRRLREDPDWHRRIVPLLVRPFDLRHVVYADYLLARARRGVMDHMLGGDNLGLIVARQCKEDPGALATSWIAGHKAVSAYDINSLFPLFLRCAAPEGSGEPSRIANLRPSLRRGLAELYNRSLAPEEIFAYVYAVLYSPPYRARYHGLLQKDFPRVPFPLSADRFTSLADLGGELLGLHLLRDERLLRPRSSFSGDSRRPLASPRPRLGEYREQEGRIDLNDHGLCFEGVTLEAWRYRIGGHQVLARWLRARRGRVLPSREVSAFRWMAEALERTLALQARLAAAYQEVEEGMAVLRLETGRNGGGRASCT